MLLINRTLILFKYLWETTDEAHPVSLADTSAHLAQYDITADPRTLRRDIEQLVDFGVDIVKDRRVQDLYHVATGHFNAPEVKLPLRSGKNRLLRYLSCQFVVRIKGTKYFRQRLPKNHIA